MCGLGKTNQVHTSDDERFQIGARETPGLQSGDNFRDRIIQLEHLCRTAFPFAERLWHRFLEELVDSTKDWVIRPTTQAASLFMRRTQREIGRLLELEGKIDFPSGFLFRERARHSNRLERLLLDVVRLLRVERKDLEGDLRFSTSNPTILFAPSRIA